MNARKMHRSKPVHEAPRFQLDPWPLIGLGLIVLSGVMALGALRWLFS